MGLLLTASRLYIPRYLQRRKIRELFVTTAAAFESPMPSLKGLNLDECLTQYALFTRQNAERALEQKTELSTKNRLYQGSWQSGRKIREDFKINTNEEIMRMSEVIYRILRIDFQGDSKGDILIKRCLFSRYYSADVCRIISSLDEGLLAGLSGGGKLEFSQRITEGQGCCRAKLMINKEPI
jgi:hypothetical protein